MMDHPEAHERIADLALEPGALAAALATAGSGDRELAAHVATCDRCRAEIQAWRGVHGSLERSLRATDPGGRAGIEPIEAGDALRSRILAAAAIDGPRRGTPALGRIAARPPRIGSTLLGLAAALVVAVAGTLLLAGPGTDLARTVGEARTLSGAIAAVDRILADPGHQIVNLHTTAGQSGGSIAWSSQDLVVLTSALPPPASGSVYRCWLVGKSTEQAIGQMDFAGSTAFWVGSLDEWASTALRPGWSFYVTLESGPAGSHRAGPVILEADFTT
jgi:hypothetical protein